MATVMTPIISIMSIINTLQQAYAAAQLKSLALTDAQTGKEKKKALVQGSSMAAGIISAFSEGGIPGVIAGIAIAGALLAVLVGVGLAIAASAGAFKQESGAEKAAKDINALSKEIYELNKKSQEIHSVTSKFDDLDNKVLKTNKDLEEMNTLLDSAADALSDEEKEYYSTLDTYGKARYLKEVEDKTNNELKAKRNAQKLKILTLKNLGGANWQDFLTSDNAEIMQARTAMYSLNNVALYEYIDLLKETTDITEEAASATEKLVQSILSEVKADKAAELLNNPELIKKYTNAIKDLQSTYTDAEGKIQTNSASIILGSDDYSITERTKAFKQLKQSIIDLGDEAVLEAFLTINKE